MTLEKLTNLFVLQFSHGYNMDSTDGAVSEDRGAWAE